MDTYRVERIVSVVKGNENTEVRAVAIPMRGGEPVEKERAEVTLILSPDNSRIYFTRQTASAKMERVKIDKVDRFLYVVSGHIKKMETKA